MAEKGQLWRVQAVSRVTLTAGMSARTRVAARRDRLLVAGLELFVIQGYLHATIDPDLFH